MIELKVQCDCGQKFKFDVKPVNGQMPFLVTCPICGRDGTTKANGLLQQIPQAAAPAPAQASAPAAIAPAMSIGPSKLRVNASAPTPAHAEPAPVGAGSTPPPIGSLPRRAIGAATPAAADPSAKPPSFGMGLLGACIGAAIGGVLYFTIFKFTGSVILLRYVLALGVGALAGWLANLLGRGEGSKELGGLAAVFTLVGILAAQYFLTLDKWHSREGIDNLNQSIEDGGFAESVKQAKAVVKAMPNSSDAEIRVYLAKQQAEDGQPPKLEAISNDEVKQFRESELTNYLDLAEGRLTKEAFWAKNGFDPKEAKQLLNTEDNAVSGLAVIIAVFKAGIISMIAGAGMAYKLSTNAD